MIQHDIFLFEYFSSCVQSILKISMEERYAFTEEKVKPIRMVKVIDYG